MLILAIVFVALVLIIGTLLSTQNPVSVLNVLHEECKKVCNTNGVNTTDVLAFVVVCVVTFVIVYILVYLYQNHSQQKAVTDWRKHSTWIKRQEELRRERLEKLFQTWLD